MKGIVKSFVPSAIRICQIEANQMRYLKVRAQALAWEPLERAMIDTQAIVGVVETNATEMTAALGSFARGGIMGNAFRIKGLLAVLYQLLLRLLTANLLLNRQLPVNCAVWDP